MIFFSRSKIFHFLLQEVLNLLIRAFTSIKLKHYTNIDGDLMKEGNKDFYLYFTPIR